MEPKRVDKVNYYLNIADAVLERSTCLRRHYGAIIVRNDEIVSTGYNGAPRGRKNCVDLGRCTREELQVPSGQRYELCRSVHAETNAIISAARSECIGGTMYLVAKNVADDTLLTNLQPCPMCRRMIINAGLSKVVIRRSETTYDVINVQEWVFNDDSVIDPNEFQA